MQHAQFKIKFDRQAAFLLYAQFCGDAVRTAAALNIKPCDILEVSKEAKWDEQIQPILELKASGRPGDVERALNRAVNFVQAYKLKIFLERVLHKLDQMKDEDIEDFVFQSSVRDGVVTKKLDMRPLTDLVAAVEKAHALTYAALGDTATERIKRVDNVSANLEDIHVKMADAFARIKAGDSRTEKLFDARLRLAQSAELEKIPDPPKLVDDSHVEL
jgi:hypothetical protein